MNANEFIKKLDELLKEATGADALMLSTPKEYGELVENTIKYLEKNG